MVASVALLIASCGGTDDAPQDVNGAGQGSGFPVTVDRAGEEVTIRRAPRRIVSLSPTATETLFAIGAGAQTVAVDDQSDYPPEAPRTDLSAYQANVEAIADYRPDLVIASDEASGELVAKLDKLSIPVLAQRAPKTLRAAYGQMRQLGLVTGHPEGAARVIRATRSRVNRSLASVPEGSPLAVFHELDPELYTASSNTFIGQIYERLGLTNIADRAAQRAGTEYPQLSAEAIVTADPDLVILADSECCNQTPARVAERPGWDRIAAVREGTVVAIDDDIASRWGPRVATFVSRVVEAIERARGAAAGA